MTLTPPPTHCSQSRMGPDRVRRRLLSQPQELQVLLDRTDRKAILTHHRPGPLPIEHDALHPHDLR
jgi:hypothetical protein